jgi:hypothetical protein
MFLFENRSDLFVTRPILRVSSTVQSLSLFPWDGELYSIFGVCVCVCAVRSYVLVLHISGETEFTKFCLCSVFHFIDLLLTSTKFSQIFEIINMMLLHSINISHNLLC